MRRMRLMQVKLFGNHTGPLSNSASGLWELWGSHLSGSIVTTSTAWEAYSLWVCEQLQEPHVERKGPSQAEQVIWPVVASDRCPQTGTPWHSQDSTVQLGAMSVLWILMAKKVSGGRTSYMKRWGLGPHPEERAVCHTGSSFQGRVNSCTVSGLWHQACAEWRWWDPGLCTLRRLGVQEEKLDSRVSSLPHI